MSSYTVERRNPGSLWWLLLLQGIAAIILGVLLLLRPAATIQAIVIFLGIYWLVTGVITLVSLIWDRSQWGLKLITGVVGIIAGLFIVRNPIISAFVVPASFALVLGVIGLLVGIGQLIQAFRGGGWGIGILGVLSIILGILLITNPAIGGLSLAFMLGILLILGGIVAIFGAFSLRRLGKEYDEAQAAASRSAAAAGSTVSSAGSRAAGSVGATTAGVAGATAAGVAVARQVSPDTDRGAPGWSAAEVADSGADAVRGVSADAADVAAAGADAVRDAATDAAGLAAAGMDAALDAGESAVGAVEAVFTGNVSPLDMDEMVKFKNPLEYIEGVGPAFAEKLKAIGIFNCLDLIKWGYTPKGRAEIAQRSGVAGNLILEWVNHVDLYRIKGVGSEYADLLEASGVDTVVELAQRNPVNLFERMNTVNQEKQLVRRPPTQAQVQDWVVQAKGLPRVITY
jgi:uncharacterized membrane protein HdeD (DUF308 family)/predicted flap endonuclease-1-like 5' DNA nuclease